MNSWLQDNVRVKSENNNSSIKIGPIEGKEFEFQSNTWSAHSPRRFHTMSKLGSGILNSIYSGG